MKILSVFSAALLAAAVLAGCRQPQATLTKSGLKPADFDTLYNGKQIALFTLTNSKGMEVCITNFGGRIVSVMVPDRQGAFRDVVLGFDRIADYLPDRNDSNFGALIGRYGNRIKLGRFSLDGKDYQLPQNNNGHCLHGGPDGWHYQILSVLDADSKHVKFERLAPDGEAGFPGNIEATVTYTLTEDNAIDIRYEATTDAPTILNLTNHSYFNLAGDPGKHSVCDDELYLNASNFTPVDSTLMTTGEILPVAGTPLDFTASKRIGQDIGSDFDQIVYGRGYDHNFVLDTRGDDTAVAVECYCPESGIDLKVYTNEPGMQVYSGNFLDGTVTGKKGVAYPKRSAICFESQKYPDSPNKPEWPTPVLRPGETYDSHCVYAFSVR